MPEPNRYAQQLSLSNLLREPALRAAIRALKLPAGSWGLDAGCGIGSHTVLLAQAVGPNGRVTGLDVSPDLLALARQHAEDQNVSAHVDFREGDVNHLPFDDHAFDWVWCVDTVYGGALTDPRPIVKEFARVVAPGGSVMLLFWSAQKLLPGYPLLEAKFDAAFAEMAPYLRGTRPERHFLRALGWLRDADLDDLSARTFVADVHAPLSESLRNALTMTFQMFWEAVEKKVTREEWAEFERLCQPESSDFILDQADYYAFLTYSLFRGKVPT